MTCLNPNYDTILIPSLQNLQNKCQKSSFTYDRWHHLILPLPPVHALPTLNARTCCLEVPIDDVTISYFRSHGQFESSMNASCHGYLCELLGRPLYKLIDYIMIKMKIAPICLLTACKRRKFKLFGVSAEVRAIDNGITCWYWSASLSNRLRVLKAHSSLFKCCEKSLPNYMYWIPGAQRGSWVWVFLRLFVSLKLIFIVSFNF